LVISGCLDAIGNCRCAHTHIHTHNIHTTCTHTTHTHTHTHHTYTHYTHTTHTHTHAHMHAHTQRLSRQNCNMGVEDQEDEPTVLSGALSLGRRCAFVIVCMRVYACVCVCVRSLPRPDILALFPAEALQLGLPAVPNTLTNSKSECAWLAEPRYISALPCPTRRFHTPCI
jgi:hypothetical protein